MGSHANSTEEINSYLESLWLERGLAENTLSAYRRDLTDTANLLQTLGINQISAAGEGDLLEVLNDRHKRQLSPRSNARWLSTLKGSIATWFCSKKSLLIQLIKSIIPSWAAPYPVP